MSPKVELDVTYSSEKLKCVDLHPSKPFLISGMYRGDTSVFNYTEQDLKHLSYTDKPMRCVRYVPRMNWIISASDDCFIRVFDFDTREEVRSFKAHDDYIRSFIAHPTEPYLITASGKLLLFR